MKVATVNNETSWFKAEMYKYGKNYKKQLDRKENESRGVNKSAREKGVIEVVKI